MPKLLTIYQRLFDAYGSRHWWPADSAFEMAVGAILTQNTNWQNVEKAIANLRLARVLEVDKLNALTPAELESLIRPSGFFRQKAERLQLFTGHLRQHYAASLEVMLQQPLESLRAELLSLKGIGPETADSILLYAGEHPAFVVDAYTGRIFERLGILTGREKYAEIRQLFMQELPRDVALYNEYHALIVAHAKAYCKKKPACDNCPLAKQCRYLLDQQKSLS